MAARQEVCMAPVSREMGKLLHQLQAQIIREAADRADEDGAIVLANDPPKVGDYTFNDEDHVTYYGERSRFSMIRRRFIPEAWIGSDVPWHPSHWRCEESRVDANGRRWNTEQRVCVTDDFGNLVEVSA